MKDDLHDGTLQLLTPQKLPVSFGALGAHKILSRQLWLHSLLRSFRLNVQRKIGAKRFCFRIATRAIQERIRYTQQRLSICCSVQNHYLPLVFG